VSYGSAFLKAAIGATRKLAQEILEKGTITALKEGMQTPEIASVIAKRKTG
jgi:2-methylisocitrate lyase-like PEP mutase family enzyme